MWTKIIAFDVILRQNHEKKRRTIEFVSWMFARIEGLARVDGRYWMRTAYNMIDTAFR